MADWDYSEFWNETLKQIRTELGEQDYTMWFSSLSYLRAGEREIFVAVPSQFFQDKFSERYKASVERTLRELTGKDLAVKLELRQKKEGPEETVSEPPPNRVGTKAAEGGNQAQAAAAAAPKKKDRHPQLRDDYTFDRYVIGENNKVSANAAMGIAKNPGKAYNPLFLYGGVGLGKTHLIQAIGNYIHQNSGNKIIYITAEDFLNEFVDALAEGKMTKENKMSSFKNKFRRVDVLLIDDIHIIEGKSSLQEELFYTFDSLYNAKKQMVFTCDRPASELKKTTERLVSRLKMGFNIDISPPDFETRCAILKSKVPELEVPVPDEVISLISKNVSTNIRDLEGAMTTLVKFSAMMETPITVEFAQQRLKDVFASPQQGNISVESIQRAVADYFSLSLADLTRKKRTKKLVIARQIAMYISRKITDYSTIELGQYFGGRDHATVLYSCQKMEEAMLLDPNLDAMVQKIERTIKENNTKS
ncbi:chromosomal replication initiator protein DnaA [Spirochaetia bacterium]|nr:chromosomal replication initiator protein DnaA [Spirochaetia bacterium]